MEKYIYEMFVSFKIIFISKPIDVIDSLFDYVHIPGFQHTWLIWKKKYILYMQHKETEKKIKKAEGRKMMQISIILLVSISTAYTIWKWHVLEMNLSYIKDQYLTEEICQLFLAPNEIDGFDKGMGISETSKNKSQYFKFYWWTK